MRVALAVIRARLRAHEWPRPVEFRAALDENDVDPREAETVTRQYAAATGSTSSHEDSVIAALRGFALRQ